MEKCFFCDIAGKQVAASIVYEDDELIAFLDKSPIFKGHTLLIPKKHIETIFDLGDSYLISLGLKAKLLANGIKEGLNVDGVLLINNNVISQSVPHYHVHIIPRKRGEPLKGFMWPRTNYKDSVEEEEFRRKIYDAVMRLMVNV